MNTSQLKKFAQNARRKLLQQVEAKLEYVLTQDTAELREKAAFIQKLKEELERIGKAALIDKVAYTWFNRLMALRFMDANDYQPAGIRIVSPQEGYTLPQILDQAKQGHFPEEINIDKQKVLDILDGRLPSRNPQNEAFRYLLIAACNALHQQFPFLFERINDYTELLLPDDLTSEFSIVHDVVAGMPTEDCQEVEVIGWLYQFYISERKDEVFAKKGKVKKEDIPAATQLFTPRWIVEYMVQNTLGKLWLQNRPISRLRDHMPYFIESPSVQADDYLRVASVEEITLLDQACGSGHILVYAFELLTKIYEEEGYNTSDIPKLIIEKNLYGFEIDDRAAQLAGLSLLMKARSYYRRLFRKELQPNILCFEDVKFAEGELEQYFERIQLDIFNQELKQDIQRFEQATNLGALIQLHTKNIPQVQASLPPNDIFLAKTHTKVQSVLRQMGLLNRQFHCVVDNPPYMGGGNMNKPLAAYVKKNYPDGKADLMAAFMEAGLNALYTLGYLGMINQHSWMFLSSYEKLRKKLIGDVFFDTLLHLGARTFPEIGGEIVQNASFTFWNTKREEKGVYLRLVAERSSELKRTKTIEGIQNKEIRFLYNVDQKHFKKLPGNPISYWLSDKIVSSFKSKNISDYGKSKAGIVSGNDFLLIRFWHETPIDNISFNEHSFNANLNSDFVPINKGGSLRKYFGNQEHIININKLWDGKSTNHSVRRGDSKYYFRKAITWSYISNVKFGFRLSENVVFATQSPAIFVSMDENFYYILGLLNSKLSNVILPAINPTVSLVTSNVESIPLIISDDNFQIISSITRQQVKIAKDEWNTNELSWDFQKNELLRHQAQDLEETYDLYRQYWKNKFYQLHRNEEELNRQFIEIYGLQEELTPDVPLEDITILKEETSIENGQLVFDAQEVFAQFVSYAVGCMMGRYSLDKDGLILANKGEALQNYWEKIGQPAPNGEATRFIPDDDAIIPVLDDEWFEDDVVGRFYEFLKVTFGKQDFQKNLDFLEAQLGKDIRKYFVRDFYKDHIKRYKKRPIYWLFASPQGSFSVLVYLHRYTPDTLNNILNNYLREYIQKLKSQKAHYEQIQISGSTAEQNKATKSIDKLDKMILDCEAYERDILYPLATERIAIDLDDGVLVNYNKLGQAVKEVKGLNDKKKKAKVREFDWIDVEEIRD